MLQGEGFRGDDFAGNQIDPVDYSPLRKVGILRIDKGPEQEVDGKNDSDEEPEQRMILADQKGISLLAGAIWRLMQLDIQVVLLGTGLIGWCGLYTVLGINTAGK